jgi:hypothetical protein
MVLKAEHLTPRRQDEIADAFFTGDHRVHKDGLGTPIRPHAENADTVFLVAARLRVALVFDRFRAIPRFPRI